MPVNNLNLIVLFPDVIGWNCKPSNLPRTSNTPLLQYFMTYTVYCHSFAVRNSVKNAGVPPALIAPKQYLVSQQLNIEGEKLPENVQNFSFLYLLLQIDYINYNF